MYNPITGQEMSTTKVQEVATIAAKGLFSTIVLTTLSLTGGIHNTLSAMNETLNK